MSTKKEPKELAKQFYTVMYRMRRFEEEVFEFYKRGLMPGLAHLYLGEEAVAAGACVALREDDYIGSTHRGHGHTLAKGARVDRSLAELYGRATGYCKGKGGSMHIADMEKMNHLGANGIVGAGQPISAGSALASKIMGDDSVTVGCFGDGSTNEGSFHESLNMAAAWKLPLVWFIENNCYGVSTEIHRVTNTPDLASRAAAYGVPYAVVDGTDAIAVYEAMKVALDHARSGKGPYVVEAKVYRYQGHYCGDPAVYRPKEYMEHALANDGIEKLGRRLLESGAAQEELDAIHAELGCEGACGSCDLCDSCIHSTFHHHHHADEVFTSWGVETAKKFSKADIEHALTELDTGNYGMILRSKGIVDGGADGWLEFDYVPGEWEVRARGADVGGKLVVIGSKLDEKAIAALFGC